MALAGRASHVATEMVGRESELDELARGLREAAEGGGCLALVSGEAGIGKTSLVETLAALAAGAGVRCLWGRCWENRGAAPYWPWRQVIAASVAEIPPEVLRGHLGAGAADVAQLAPELCQRLPGLTATARCESADARARLFDSVARYLAALPGEHPVLVALEDLHASDEPSLRLLLRLAPELAGARLMVVATYRNDDVAASPGVRRLLAAVARHATVLSLSGIGESGVAELVERSAGPAVSPSVIRRVHEITGGNPFLVHEVLRQFRWTGRADPPHLPDDAQLVVVRRLEGLDTRVVDLVSRAAVLGREFDVSTLSTLDGRSVAAVIDDLQGAHDAGLVHEVGLGRWAFSHSLYRESLYDRLPPDVRVELHRRAGDALEQHPGVAVAELAHHFSLSGPGESGAKALRYCARAGDAAMEALAFEEGALFYARALGALAGADSTEGQRRYDLSTKLGEARFRAGDLAAARDAYRAALGIARALADPELLARAAVGFAGPYESTQLADEASTRVLEEAMAALPERDSPLRARLLVALGGRQLAMWTTWDQTAPLSRQGLDMARRVGDPVVLHEVLWEWHRNVYFMPETLAERLAVADELIAAATTTGSRERLVWALQWRAADRFETGDLSGAEADLDAAGRLARELRLPLPLWGATFPKVVTPLLEGRFADAERFATEALAVGERMEFLPVEMNHLGQLMAIRRHQGRFKELDELIALHSEKFGWGPDDSRWAIRALARAELGDHEEARSLLARSAPAALASARARGLRILSVLADVCWLLGEAEVAAAVHQALFPFPGRHVLDGIAAYSLGSSDRSLAQTAALLERWDEAEERFEDAQRLHERLGARVWAAQTRMDQATMLLRRRRPGDEHRAAEVLEAAEAGYRSLGTPFYKQRAAMMRARLPAVGPQHRQRAVCSLGADGWTIDYAGTIVHLADGKGLRYLARLLHNPHRRFHATELLDDAADGDAERAPARGQARRQGRSGSGRRRPPRPRGASRDGRALGDVLGLRARPTGAGPVGRLRMARHGDEGEGSQGTGAWGWPWTFFDRAT